MIATKKNIKIQLPNYNRQTARPSVDHILDVLLRKLCLSTLVTVDSK